MKIRSYMPKFLILVAGAIAVHQGDRFAWVEGDGGAIEKHFRATAQDDFLRVITKEGLYCAGADAGG